MVPRVRFAPSPTGFLHVGGARTALFNWLYARRHGGTFVLRIEDTDQERSSVDMVTGILDGLRWLGLTWDEGPGVGGPHAPYFQSERLARYRAVAAQLVADGHAYYCYCSQERLRAEREKAEKNGMAWQYDRTCLTLSPEKIAELEAVGAPRAIRFKVPAGTTAFDDSVHGRIAFDSSTIEDFVVLRSDDHPTYHLSVVVDDVEMGITEVIRGDDHISNTPKHVLLFNALGTPAPTFAHVPLILGSDKKRLSKRHGATSVTEYQRQGYLPEAMVNFLALLGWSPGDDRELMSTPELIERFTLEGISGGNAVFDTAKLDWMNGQYIARLLADELVERVTPLLVEAGLLPSSGEAGEKGTTRDDSVVQELAAPKPANTGEELVSPKLAQQAEAGGFLHRLLELLRPRVKRLNDFVEQARPFLADTVQYEEDAVAKHLTVPDLASHLAALATALTTTTPFDESHVEATVREIAAQRGLKAGTLIHTVRVALTGRTASPGLFEVIVLLGRERTLARLAQLEAFVTARA